MNLVFVESNTTGSGMLAFARAVALGATPVLATADPGRYRGLAETGVRTVACDTNTVSTMTAQLHAELGEIAGITTTSEFYTATAARCAAELGLPGNPPAAVAACRDKGRMRELHAAARLPSPAFAVIRPDAPLEPQVLGALSRIALPCVAKPVDDTGSFGVRLCSTVAETVEVCRRVRATTVNVRGQRTSRTALVEGYLDGPEFSLEMISEEGRHRCVGIVAKQVTRPPHFVERGHVYPAPLPPYAAETLIRTAHRALSVLGVAHGISHVEMKLIGGRAYLVEVNARPAGGMIPELIACASGFDLLDAQLRSALGLPQLPLPEPTGPAGIAFVLAPGGSAASAAGPGAEAELVEVAGADRARAVPGVESVTVTAAPGSVVRPATSAYDRLGYVIARAPDHQQLRRTLDVALGRLRPVLRRTSPAADR